MAFNLDRSLRSLSVQFFRERWRRLLPFDENLKGAGHPGVYLLAYEARSLEGKTVRARDVYYVGRTFAGISKRLKQFVGAINKGVGHSGGNRFYHEVGRYDTLIRKNKGRFYVAFVEVQCEYKKGPRRADDLRKMAVVAALEYHSLARILEEHGEEPWLNEH